MDNRDCGEYSNGSFRRYSVENALPGDLDAAFDISSEVADVEKALAERKARGEARSGELVEITTSKGKSLMVVLI